MNKTHRIEWTMATELPMPLYAATAVVKDYKVYIAGSSGRHEETKRKVFEYDISENRWSTLPDPGVNLAAHEVIDGMLTLVGGRHNLDNKCSKQLFSFDESTRSWIKKFPDMSQPRNRCSVVIYNNNVIVAGGTSTNNNCLNSIEVMCITHCDHYHKLCWREVATRLPFRMWNMSTTICDNDMFIIGCAHYNFRYGKAYKLAVSNILNSPFAEVWKELHLPSSATTTTVVPYTFPPVIVGGNSSNFNSIADVSIYDIATDTWSVVGKLKTGRAYPTVAAVDDKAIIVIGGCSKVKNFDKCSTSSLKTVEIGQVVPKDF